MKRNAAADVEYKRIVIQALTEIGEKYGKKFSQTSPYVFQRSLDLACHDAWITEDFPAYEKWGTETSLSARVYFPVNVQIAKPPRGLFDLVTLIGDNYANEQLMKTAFMHASNIIVISYRTALEWRRFTPSETAIQRYRARAEQVFSKEFTLHDNSTHCLRAFKIPDVTTPIATRPRQETKKPEAIPNGECQSCQDAPAEAAHDCSFRVANGIQDGEQCNCCKSCTAECKYLM